MLVFWRRGNLIDTVAFEVTILSFLLIMSQATIKNSRAEWSPAQEKFFPENLPEQANLGKKSGGGFRKEHGRP